ncbi:hypothetical protein Y032_0015g2771 [Ancylostoma ceylanicum]|uniref:Fungal lipase-type domain-containing protein n=1 Tax=Ancylostoma ceylanicum TaxID=53326 RepID=A0A016VAB4_9BILA|nr:hypothetical protein Y032_0015g2771 [Ancylostoma ceylanicum]
MLLPYILISLSLLVAVSCYGRVTNYNETIAKKLLGMAAAAYGDQPQMCLDRMFPSHDVQIVLSTTKKMCDSFGNTCESYIAASNKRKELDVVFRGSRTTGQIILQGLNSFIGVNFFGMGVVNRYFKIGLNVLWPPIRQVLKDPKYAEYKVVFTGHSLGGALATVAAARAAREGLRPGEEILVYTFGAPRVGDTIFAANFNKIIPNCYRVVFRQDIVPHLPPCTKMSTYDEEVVGNICVAASLMPYHQGTEIWYSYSMRPGSDYIECVGNPKGEDAACSNTFQFSYNHYEDYTFDHRHYFAVQVPEFGKAGCDVSTIVENSEDWIKS